IRFGVYRVLLPEPLRFERPLARPEFVECICVVQPPVLHDLSKSERVLNVFQRIFVEHEKIRELARLKAPQFGIASNHFTGVESSSAQNFARCYAACCERLEFPVVGKSIDRAVASDADEAASPHDLRRALREARIQIFLRSIPLQVLDLLIDEVMGSESIELGVVVERGRSQEVVLALRSAVSDLQRQRVAVSSAREELNQIVKQRNS